MTRDELINLALDTACEVDDSVPGMKGEALADMRANIEAEPKMGEWIDRLAAKLTLVDGTTEL